MIQFNQDIATLENALRSGGLTTPKKIDADVFAFYEYVRSSEKPIYLDVKPFHWCRVNCCDLNVKKAINSNGGKPIYGFKIWSVPSFYIEADLHCVWEDQTGNLLEITPTEDGDSNESSILFLPEPQLNTVRLVVKGDKPRLALRESLYDLVALMIEKESEIGCYYPPDEEMWKNSIPYKRLKKRKTKK